MSNIKNWSTTPASNSSAPPQGAPEGMAPSTVNNTMRQQMADHRTQWEDAEWFDWGHALVFQSANSFLVSITATQIYTTGRRLKLIDGGVTILADVLASSPSGANTLITISGSALSSSLSSGYVSILDPTNWSVPYAAVISAGIAEIAATKAQMEAASLTSVVVTPARFHNHPGAIKAWVNFGSGGAINNSYNVAAVNKTTVGDFTISFSASFANSDYATIGSSRRIDNTFVNVLFGTTKTPGAVEVLIHDATGNRKDADNTYVIVLGDL